MRTRINLFWAHTLGVTFLVVAAGVVFVPVLAHGLSFGTFDLTSVVGLLQRHGVVVHNTQAGDQIDEILPWNTLSWIQVHHGQLPLWNPYSALGTPFAFNFQSGAFSLQALVGYLFPLRLAYTAQVVLTVLIAGTGAYVFGRVMRLGILACVFAGTVFELCGPVVGWLGWPNAAVLSFAGWWFAAALLVIRGEHRVRNIAFFAVIMAFAVYAGQIAIFTLLAMALGVFVITLLQQSARLSGGSGPALRSAADVLVATVAGAALAAPLLLPGVQLGEGSVGNLAFGDVALPLGLLSHALFASFNGLPVHGSQSFGLSNIFYSETVFYVGVITVVFGGAALVLRRRRPEVIALAVVVLGMFALAFIGPVVSFMNRMPLVGHVLWHRSLLPMAFALAALGGVGIDLLVKSPLSTSLRIALGCGFVSIAALLIVVWIFGRGHLSPLDTSIRARSFIWPAIETVIGLVVVGILTLLARRSSGKRDGNSNRIAQRLGPWAAVAVLVGETAFLAASSGPSLTSSPTFFATTPAVVSLKRTVGTSLVGFGPRACLTVPGLGVPVDENVAYGVRELGAYDPFLQQAAFSSWQSLAGKPAGFFAFYCPDISSVSLAHLFGVSFVLEHGGTQAPAGAIFDKRLGDEVLYRIPGSESATLTAMTSDGKLPNVFAPGTPVAVAHPDSASWKLVTHSSFPRVLRLRLTNVPGWHASIDGRPLALMPFAGTMFQAVIPAGRHMIELHYWPDAFTAGLYLTGGSVGGLCVASVIGSRRRRKRVSVEISSRVAAGDGPDG